MSTSLPDTESMLQKQQSFLREEMKTGSKKTGAGKKKVKRAVVINYMLTRHNPVVEIFPIIDNVEVHTTEINSVVVSRVNNLSNHMLGLNIKSNGPEIVNSEFHVNTDGIVKEADMWFFPGKSKTDLLSEFPNVSDGEKRKKAVMDMLKNKYDSGDFEAFTEKFMKIELGFTPNLEGVVLIDGFKQEAGKLKELEEADSFTYEFFMVFREFEKFTDEYFFYFENFGKFKKLLAEITSSIKDVNYVKLELVTPDKVANSHHAERPMYTSIIGGQIAMDVKVVVTFEVDV